MVTATLSKGAAKFDYEMTPLGTPPITVTVIGQPINPPDHNVHLSSMAFETRGLSGEPIRVPNDYRGRLVVVHFWASWCAACTREMPYWLAATRAFNNRGVAFVGISLDKNRAHSLDGVRAKSAQSGMTWPQSFDDASALSMKFKIKSLPAVFVVEGDTGRVLAQGWSIRGENLSKELETLVRQRNLISTPPVSKPTSPPTQLPAIKPAPQPAKLEELKVVGTPVEL